MRLRNIHLVAVLFGVIFFCVSAYAVEASSSPSSEEPAAQASRQLKEFEKEKERFEEKNPKPAEMEIQEEKEKKPAPSVKFILEQITVTGSTVFNPNYFKDIYQPYLKKTVTFDDLNAITVKIKAKYKEKGYLTTMVFVPEQNIADGKVEIRVLEGKMGALNVENNQWFSADRIKQYIHTKKGQLLNVFSLQKDLLRLNQKPDLELKSVISAGKEPGETDVTLKVIEKMPHHMSEGFDDQGTRLTGKYRMSLLLWSTDITHHFDSLMSSSQWSASSFGQSFSYERPLDTYGTKIGLDAALFNMELGKDYNVYNITGQTTVFTPHISWELALSEDFQATIQSGLEIKTILKEMQKEETSHDELRVPYLSLNMTKTDSNGQTSFSPRVAFGTSDFLGASSLNHPSAARDNTGGFFFKYEQSLSRLQRMPWNSYASIKSQFQTTSSTLPASEQMQLGGFNSIRGYPEGDTLVDTGAILNIDWIFPMYLFPSDWKLPKMDTPLRQQIQPVIFFDIGGGSLKTVNPGERPSNFLMGEGLGLRINMNKYFSLRLEWARHLDNEPAHGSGPSTFYVSLQSQQW